MKEPEGDPDPTVVGIIVPGELSLKDAVAQAGGIESADAAAATPQVERLLIAVTDFEKLVSAVHRITDDDIRQQITVILQPIAALLLFRDSVQSLAMSGRESEKRRTCDLLIEEALRNGVSQSDILSELPDDSRGQYLRAALRNVMRKQSVASSDLPEGPLGTPRHMLPENRADNVGSGNGTDAKSDSGAQDTVGLQ